MGDCIAKWRSERASHLFTRVHTARAVHIVTDVTLERRAVESSGERSSRDERAK